MLNQLVLVGRLTDDPDLRELEGGKKVTTVCLAVPRSFKNMEGLYDTDFIECILWEHIAQNTTEYCHKGDLIGVRGRLQIRTIENQEGKKISKLEVIAEKVNFLSSKKKE